MTYSNNNIFFFVFYNIKDFLVFYLFLYPTSVAHYNFIARFTL